MTPDVREGAYVQPGTAAFRPRAGIGRAFIEGVEFLSEDRHDA
jgi:hypothetical protein